MTIEHSQNSDMFFVPFCHILEGPAGPGPLGPVRKIWVVWSGPKGPQFPRSVGTLLNREVVYGSWHYNFQTRSEGASRQNTYRMHTIITLS